MPPSEGLVHKHVAFAILASCKLDLVLHCRVVATKKRKFEQHTVSVRAVSFGGSCLTADLSGFVKTVESFIGCREICIGNIVVRAKL